MTEEVEKKKQRAPTMDAKQRLEAVTLYRAGEHSVDEIAKIVGSTPAALRRYFIRKGVKRGELKEELEAKRKAAMEQAFVLDPIVHARRVFETKNETYRILEMLRKLVGTTVVETHKNKQPMGTIAQDMKAIREAATAIKVCREEAYAVLGIKEDDLQNDNLPELTIKGLDDQQILDLQSSSVTTDVMDVQDPDEADA